MNSAYPASASILLAALALPCALSASDAIVVNSDGTTQFTYTVSGPNILATKTPVGISASQTLDSTAAGKLYALSGTTDFTVTLPPAGIGSGVLVGFSVAPRANAPKQYTLSAVSGQTVDGRQSLVLIHTNAVLLVSNGSAWTCLTKKVDTDWVNEGTINWYVGGAAVSKGAVGPSDIDALAWRRIGGSIELDYRFQAGVGGAKGTGLYTVNLPSGLIADTSKVPVNASTDARYAAAGDVGSFSSCWQGSGSRRAVGRTCLYTNSSLMAWAVIDSSGGSADTPWNSDLDITPAKNPFAFCIRASVPIVGW